MEQTVDQSGNALCRRVMLAYPVVLIAVALAAMLALAPAARADRDFSQRFSANANGDIAVAANTLETCPSSAAGCEAARAGTGSMLNNNGFTMERVDSDSDPATFDSSSARLDLPAGAQVMFAALYYGARTDAGTRGTKALESSPTALRAAELKLPGDSDYTRLGDAGSTLDQSTQIKGAYQVVHDVTDLVRRAGAGDYTVADVQSATGEDRYAGWALVVAYAAPGDPPRNLTVFDGFSSVTAGQPSLTIPVSGFQTPLTGPVRTQLGFVAYEGDLGSSGDSAALDGTPLTDAVNPPRNFFNSGISIDGAPVQSKSPDYRNQLGFDAKLVRVDGILPNAATSADIALRTTLDQYLPGAVTFATDLYAPDVQATKTVDNLTHPGDPASAGDRLRYTVTYRNSGAEAAQNVVATDPLPAGVTLVPGSVQIAGAAPPDDAATDLAGDDLGDYDPGTHTLRFFLGDGATAGGGGTLAAAGSPGSDATVSFEVEVDPTQMAYELTNTAQASFLAPTLGTQLSAISDPATIEVHQTEQPPAEADIAVADHETDAATPDGGEVLDTVTVSDRGPDEATDVHTDVDAPPGSTVESATADDGGTCTVDALGATCDLPHIDTGGSAEIDVTELVTPTDEGDGAVNEITATGAQLDTNDSDNDAQATAAAPGPPLPAADDADLQTSVRSHHRRVTVGGEVTDTVTVHNAGPGTAVGITLSGALNLPARAVAIRASGLSCGRGVMLHCSLSRLPPGRSAVVRATWRPLRAGRLVEAVDASSDRVDPRPANDAARVAILVRPARAHVALTERVTPGSTHAGQTVQIRLRAIDTTSVPARGATACLRLPQGLALIDARGARLTGPWVCWTAATLAGHGSRSFSVLVRVALTAAPGAQLLTSARLTGDNFPARDARATLDVRGHFTACTSRTPARPGLARAAC